MKKVILRYITITLLFMAVSCEDDPILDPETGSEEEGGSYGNLSLPGSDDKSSVKNPEIF